MLKLQIDKILKSKGQSQYWLSKQTGISPNNIGKICNGETNTIRFETIEKICKALNCSINDIFDTDDPQMRRLLLYSSKLKKLQNTKGDTE